MMGLWQQDGVVAQGGVVPEGGAVPMAPPTPSPTPAPAPAAPLEKHKGHLTALVEDAGELYKETFQNSLLELRKLQDKNKQCQMNTKEKIEKWLYEILHKEDEIKFTFKELNMFLYEEKKSYQWQLEKVKEDVLQRLQDSEAELEKQSQELSNQILELERKCQGPAQGLLQGVRDTCNRISALKQHEPEVVSLDVDIKCKVPGCFSKWKETFETYKVFITLDSDTAHKDLHVNVKKYRVNNMVTCRYKAPETHLVAAPALAPKADLVAASDMAPEAYFIYGEAWPQKQTLSQPQTWPQKQTCLQPHTWPQKHTGRSPSVGPKSRLGCSIRHGPRSRLGLGRGPRGHSVAPEANFVAAPDLAPEADWVAAPDWDPAPDTPPA